MAELSAHVSGALGAEGTAAVAAPMAGGRELLETVLAEAPQMLPFEDRNWDYTNHSKGIVSEESSYSYYASL